MDRRALNMCIRRLFVMLLIFQLSYACTCDFSHPQTKFCRADFVLKAKVVEENIQYMNDSGLILEKNYLVKFNWSEVYKGRHLFQERTATINTAGSEMGCGVTLTVGVSYIISGVVFNDGSLLTTSCELTMPYSQLTPNQMRGLRFLYDRGCNCTVYLCMGDACWEQLDTASNSYLDNICLWTPVHMTNDCHSKYTFCLKDDYGVCYWKENKNLNRCINTAIIP